MKKFIALLSMAMVTMCLWVHAQSPCPFSLRGKITDGETGLVLPGVTVAVASGQQAVSSAANGTFEFNNLCHGDIVVTYSLVGYKSLQVKYHMDKSVVDQIVLHNDTCLLESITIEGKKYTDLETISVKELSGKDLEETRGLSLGESLKKIPGVTSLQTGPTISKPIIHGLSGQRVL
ncbi:MAG: TonB-dependent receptor, partial [Cytophagales bacterium]|nr:TonB-dependent receptor [Cytophagales bacterium]